MASMRILFLNPVGFLGGAERILLDVIASLGSSLPAGSSMQLICLAEGPLVDEARALGIEADTLPLPARLTRLGESGMHGGKFSKAAGLAANMAIGSPAALRYLRQFRRTVVAANADIIHSNGVKSHLLSRALPPGAGRVVWHVHDLLGGRPLLSNVLKHAARHLSGAIAISQAVADDLKKVLPGTPVFTVLNAIDTDHFSPAAEDGSVLDRLAGLSPAEPGTVRVGLVATYARWKGQDVFLEAIARLLPAAPPVRFYIVGGSIYHTSGSQFSLDELRNRAAVLGVAEKVGFVGFQTDTLSIYRALDVMVHASSKPEPFGRTIVEAMSCGRAVIISNSGGAAELFTENVDGVGVRPGNADDLAAAMAGLIGDAARRDALGKAARETALQRFSRSRLGPEFVSIYQRLI
jgi:glycosyltransferase involved in cell wall biosynthesis